MSAALRGITLIAIFVVLAGCANSGRYTQRNDSHPEYISKDIDFADVTPQFEPYNPANSRPYKVLGKQYFPLETGKGYTGTGIASWYGQKFHGHLTANGEVYNMFGMSAAHKTLPLPSFVRVTNLENGRQAVVRVNDRGPFHSNRIIDLSYAAAMKLGILSTGTAKVKLDVMHVDEKGVLTVGNQPVIETTPEATAEEQSLFIQVTASQNADKVSQLARGLASLYQVPARVPKEGNLYRLRLGPFSDKNQVTSLLSELKENGYQQAFSLYAPN